MADTKTRRKANVPVDPNQLLDSTQLAALLGFHPNWPAKARLAGDGPPFVKIGRTVRYRRSAVDAWLAVRERRST
jgi:predicted DNA-binding transcriptional regulator AlpA